MTRQPVIRSAFLRWGLLAVIQLALIGVPLADRLEVQFSGQEVTLDLVPIDPRDLLRGDYVIINLSITTLPKDLANTETLSPGDAVFVQLKADDDGVYSAQSMSRSPAGEGTPEIEGKVTGTSGDAYRIDYGIDAFFLPEGTGKQIETLDTERVKLVIALAPDGRSLPLRLLVDGQPFHSDAAF
ncbi:putative membrane-anchored protein [Roseibium hamelinense]|uniref:Putative membrane-anchored protein n=1 Tax=Roseibium hamelinense TaxID=150831 RepID=A0A562T2L7_9HYPH|nr:GDYXXLXY domain-containing protein [Roseibium hamelinense]MTI44467.1 hypothetical protein [Roseibium hamelinense]TWI87434.1 putative membrane-anchored protein [Roseibium hamelinense]